MDGIPLLWDGNYAKILGLLHEIGKYLARVGLLQPFVKHRAAVLSNRLAVYSIQSVPFIQGLIADSDAADPTKIVSYGASSFCPAIGVRVARMHAGRAARGEAAYTFPTTAPGPDYTVNPLACDQEDGKLLRVLTHVFGHTEEAEELLDAAAGSGMALHDELRRLAALASPGDIAVVSATFDRAKAARISGELTLSSLKSFLKTYKRAKIDLNPASHPSVGSEIEMIGIIAYRDPTLRDLYELKCSAAPPTTLDGATKILTGILKSRRASEQLEHAIAGTEQSSLAAALAPAPPAPPAPPTDDISAKLLAMLTKLDSKMGVKDPRKDVEKKKNKKGKKPGTPKEPEKVKPPRDEDGRITHWVEGMDPCKCGGKHLYRDCDKDKDAPKESSNVVLEQLSAEDVKSLIGAYLNGQVTEKTTVFCAFSF